MSDIKKDVVGWPGWWAEINPLFGDRARIVVTDGVSIEISW